MALLYEHGDPQGRLAFTQGSMGPGSARIQPRPDDVVQPCPVKTYPIYDGHVFDLGGVELEVVGVPGHTFGTVVLLDRARRIVYSGDACNANTLLFLPGSTTIEEYRESLLHFQSFQPYFDGMYGGHGPGPVPKHIIDEAIQLCGEIMEGTDDRVEAEFLGRPCYYARKKGPDFRREDGGIANIAYSLEGIRRI